MTFFCWVPLTTKAVSPSFAETDADMNGHLNKEEVAQIEELDFAKADENQDGILNLEEYVMATTKATNDVESR
jgi:hypothetical protein